MITSCSAKRKIRFEMSVDSNGTTSLTVADTGRGFTRAGFVSWFHAHLSPKSTEEGTSSPCDEYPEIVKPETWLMSYHKSNLNLYSNSPNRLGEDANQAKEAARGQRGEILRELIQNAHDAICDHQHSIGRFGLGSKAILGYSNDIEIHSNVKSRDCISQKYCVHFSKKRAINVLQENGISDVPEHVPIFRLPFVLNEPHPWLCDGYETIIVMRLDEEAHANANQRDAIAKIKTDLLNLDCTALLFLDHVDVIEVSVDGREISIEREDAPNEGQIGNANGSQTRQGLVIKKVDSFEQCSKKIFRRWESRDGSGRLKAALAMPIGGDGAPEATPANADQNFWAFLRTQQPSHLRAYLHFDASSLNSMRAGFHDAFTQDELDLLGTVLDDWMEDPTVNARSVLEVVSKLNSLAKTGNLGQSSSLPAFIIDKVKCHRFVPTLGGKKGRPSEVETYTLRGSSSLPDLFRYLPADAKKVLADPSVCAGDARKTLVEMGAKSLDEHAVVEHLRSCEIRDQSSSICFISGLAEWMEGLKPGQKNEDAIAEIPCWWVGNDAVALNEVCNDSLGYSKVTTEALSSKFEMLLPYRITQEVRSAAGEKRLAELLKKKAIDLDGILGCIAKRMENEARKVSGSSFGLEFAEWLSNILENLRIRAPEDIKVFLPSEKDEPRVRVGAIVRLDCFVGGVRTVRAARDLYADSNWSSVGGWLATSGYSPPSDRPILIADDAQRESAKWRAVYEWLGVSFGPKLIMKKLDSCELNFGSYPSSWEECRWGPHHQNPKHKKHLWVPTSDEYLAIDSFERVCDVETMLRIWDAVKDLRQDFKSGSRTTPEQCEVFPLSQLRHGAWLPATRLGKSLYVTPTQCNLGASSCGILPSLSDRPPAPKVRNMLLNLRKEKGQGIDAKDEEKWIGNELEKWMKTFEMDIAELPDSEKAKIAREVWEFALARAAAAFLSVDKMPVERFVDGHHRLDFLPRADVVWLDLQDLRRDVVEEAFREAGEPLFVLGQPGGPLIQAVEMLGLKKASETYETKVLHCGKEDSVRTFELHNTLTSRMGILNALPELKEIGLELAKRLKVVPTLELELGRKGAQNHKITRKPIPVPVWCDDWKSDPVLLNEANPERGLARAIVELSIKDGSSQKADEKNPLVDWIELVLRDKDDDSAWDRLKSRGLEGVDIKKRRAEWKPPSTSVPAVVSTSGHPVPASSGHGCPDTTPGSAQRSSVKGSMPPDRPSTGGDGAGSRGSAAGPPWRAGIRNKRRSGRESGSTARAEKGRHSNKDAKRGASGKHRRSREEAERRRSVKKEGKIGGRPNMASGRDAELEFQKRLTNLFGEGSVHRNKKDERRRERDFVVNKNGKECFIELKSAMIQPGSSDAIIHLTQHEIDLAKDCAEMSAPNKCYWLVIWTRDQNGSRQYAYWDSKPLRTHECAEKWEEWRFVTERQELGSSWDAACDSKTAKENLLKSTRAGNRRVVVKCKLSKMGAPLDDADLMKPIEEFIYGQRQPQSMNA